MADERRDRRIAEIDRDGSPQIDMIVLIDRDVDMVTPLCTQTTYEGLLDEVLGISATGTVAFLRARRGRRRRAPAPAPAPAPTPTRTRRGTNARKRKRSAPAWTRATRSSPSCAT